MNFGYIFEHGDAILISTFLLLIGMSLASWYVIFWKAWMLKKEWARLEMFKERYVISPDWPVRVQVKEAEGCVGMLMEEARKTTAILQDHEEVKRKELFTVHLSQGLDIIRVWLDKGLTLLASVGSSAPFIGLFGTVWGIYGALTDIATKGNASLNVVAGPMGEALIATAIGLFTAIPAVLAYNAFVRQNRVLVQRLRHISEQLTLYYEDIGQAKSGKKAVKLVAGDK